MRRCITWVMAAAGAAAGIPTSAAAQNVLVLSSSHGAIDQAALDVLEAGGLGAIGGPPFGLFTSSTRLFGIDVVYLQASANWAMGDMPLDGQQALLEFVGSGGGLVTAEWSMWKAAGQGHFVVLQSCFAVSPNSTTNFANPITYTQLAPDPTLNAGLPSAFEFQADPFGGTNTRIPARPGATVFYSSSGLENGLVGWEFEDGRVAHLSVCAGALSLADPNFSRLLVNTMKWAATRNSGTLCVPDLTTAAVAGSPGYGVPNGVLNNDDFFYFLTQFAALNLAVADLTTSAVPGSPGYGVPNGTINNDDFFYYLALFAAGC